MDSLITEAARLRLIEEMLERARRTDTTATETEQGLSYPRDSGFDGPPPPYDQVHNDDELPPSYETLGYGDVMPTSGAERRSSTAANHNSTERASEPRAHDRAPSYSIYIPPDSRSAPPQQDSITEVAAISTTLEQIQNYMEEVRERFSDVDLFISSLSIMTPPSPTEHRATFRL